MLMSAMNRITLCTSSMAVICDAGYQLETIARCEWVKMPESKNLYLHPTARNESLDDIHTLPHCPDGGAKSHRGAPWRHWGAPWGHRGAPRGIWVHLEVTGVQQSDQKSSGVHPS